MQTIPSLVPVDRWVCSSPAPCSRKAAFNPTSCNDSCASPAVMSLLLPARGSLHACIASTLGMSQSCFWWYMGFPWSCNPGVILEAAPLSPQLVGLIPASSSTRQTNISTQRRFFSYHFLLAFHNKLGEAEAEVSSSSSSLLAPLCSQAGAIPTTPLCN